MLMKAEWTQIAPGEKTFAAVVVVLKRWRHKGRRRAPDRRLAPRHAVGTETHA